MGILLYIAKPCDSDSAELTQWSLYIYHYSEEEAKSFACCRLIWFLPLLSRRCDSGIAPLLHHRLLSSHSPSSNHCEDR
jgi:hypothetical protein